MIPQITLSFFSSGPHKTRIVQIVRTPTYLPSLITLALTLWAGSASAQDQGTVRRVPNGPGSKIVGGSNAKLAVTGTPVPLAGSGVVRFVDLSRSEAQRAPVHPQAQGMTHPERNKEYVEPPSAIVAPGPEQARPARPLGSSPAPDTAFDGMGDIYSFDSGYYWIPPDVNGAVGPNWIFQNLNNNVLVKKKAPGNGPLGYTVGVNTFWGPTGAAANAYADPRSVYDPYNGRFISVMQGDLNNDLGNSLVIGLSDSDDPSALWHLYRTILYENGAYALADFPILGFNRDWITVSITMYNSAGNFTGNSVIAIHYPSLLAGALTAYRFDRADFCAAPCQTYSTTSDTEYVLVHLSSASATYRCDRICGTGPDAPTYTQGDTLARAGGGWASAGGQILPQSAPVSGVSACGASPCKLELYDAQIRTAPVFRAGSIWYTQSIGLPAGGFTHTAAQWTRITTPSGTYVDGGRIEDPTATATNGGKWYAYPQVAVNAQQNFIVTYSQFSSAQHPSAGYSVHFDSDGPGTIRDPYVSRAGDDYYNKSFGTARNRWGDFSSAQVDPVDDMTLWAVAEYAKARTDTYDGFQANTSRWGTWWSSVVTGGSLTILASAGPNGSIDPSGAVSVTAGGSQAFTMTPNPCYHVLDVQVDGSSAGPVTSYSFDNVKASHTIAVTFALNTYSISSSAGENGSIAPSGSVAVNCGADQGFTIAPAAGYNVQDVLVDGGSVGPVTSYVFNNVQADHSISASFSPDSFTVDVAVTGSGSVTKVPNLGHYPYGTSLTLTAVPDSGWGFGGWSADTVTTANPLSLVVTRNLSYTASFVDSAAPLVHVISPFGGDVLDAGTTATLSWSASDNVGVTAVDLYLSRTGASGPFDSLATGVANTGSYDWLVTGPGTTDAFLEVLAHDAAGLTGSDVSDTAFVIEDQTTAAPRVIADFALAAITPNPVRGTAVVRYAVPREANVRLTVIDVRGREVAVLATGAHGPGEYQTAWSDSRASPGLYFVLFHVPGRILERRLVRIQ